MLDFCCGKESCVVWLISDVPLLDSARRNSEIDSVSNQGEVSDNKTQQIDERWRVSYDLWAGTHEDLHTDLGGGQKPFKHFVYLTKILRFWFVKKMMKILKKIILKSHSTNWRLIQAILVIKTLMKPLITEGVLSSFEQKHGWRTYPQ